MQLYRIYDMIDFDPNKDAINFARHGISLARWVELDVAKTVIDDRYDYGELRYRSYGRIAGEAYCFVFTIRDGRYRPISLRRVHAKEMKKYVPQA